MQENIGSISSAGLLLTLCLGVLLVVLPRRYALVPLLLAGCYMTLGQSLIIGGLHFHVTRVLIAFGLVRWLVRRETGAATFKAIDGIFIAGVLTSSFLYILFSGEIELLNERLGGAYNAIGIYAIVRGVVRDFDDILHTVKILAILMIPLAVLFAVEYTTGMNPFSVFGGVPEYTQIREGKLRCQGPFGHPILAGTFGATAVPLFVGLWGYDKRHRWIVAGALLGATFLVVASSSSGPMLAYLGELIGLACWRIRSHMRSVRWGIAISLVVLHVIMKAPVWFLISRVSDLIGGSGWYRSALIDAFINHVDEWWLIGTSYTVHWMPTGVTVNSKMADIVNEYVQQGVKGGLLALVLLVWLITECFKTTGLAVRNTARFSEPNRFLIWSLGCGVLGHVVSFFSVAYFDQVSMFWFLDIGLIAAIVNSRKLPCQRDSVNGELLAS